MMTNLFKLWTVLTFLALPLGAPGVAFGQRQGAAPSSGANQTDGRAGDGSATYEDAYGEYAGFDDEYAETDLEQQLEARISEDLPATDDEYAYAPGVESDLEETIEEMIQEELDEIDYYEEYGYEDESYDYYDEYEPWDDEDAYGDIYDYGYYDDGFYDDDWYYDWYDDDYLDVYDYGSYYGDWDYDWNDYWYEDWYDYSY